jgi:hypothetical protein
MALNSDFKVKDSLYVGSSACFVSCTNTPIILSAGSSLFDIFLQEGESGSGGVLSDGTGINEFMFDGLSAASVAVSNNILSAATYVAVNGNNLIDTITTPSTQGAISFDDVNSGVTARTCNIFGLGTTSDPTFRGATVTGLSATALNSGILSGGKDLNELFQTIGSDARGKVLSDGIGIQDFTYEGLSAQSVAVSQSILSGGTSHAQGTLTLSGAGGTGYNTTVDLGLQTSDSPTFAGVTATGNLSIQGNTQLGNASSDTITIDSAGICTPCLAAGTGSSVLVRGSTSDGVVAHDVIDSKVFEQKLVDYTVLSATSIPKAADSAGTIGNSIMEELASGGAGYTNSINICGGIQATALSGDGSKITNVTATAIFPTTTKTTLVGGDKFFINDSTSKHTTYTSLLTSFGDGSGLTVDGTSLEVNGASSLTSGKITKWNGTGFTNSIMTETALGNISIAGGATITGNLSVQGDLTCIDTIISVTSALSVINEGTGPAIVARQTGTDQPIARFIDTEGGYITFDDGGKVGIGTDSPSEKLTLVGNLSTIGNATVTGTITNSGLVGGTTNTVVISDSDVLKTRAVDPRVWSIACMVDTSGGTADRIPKFSDSNSIVDTNIADTGSLVTITSNTKIIGNTELDGGTTIAAGHDLDIDATAVSGATAFGSCTKKATFSTVVTSASSHPLPTFAKTNLKQAKYNVTLIKGVNVTAFEVQAVYNNTTTCGVVYGIVDAQAATQLDTASICNGGSTIDLVLKSASGGTCAIVSAEALYLA